MAFNSQRIQSAAQASAARVKARLDDLSKGTPREAQITAAVTVPFVFYGLAVFSSAIKEVIYEGLPDGFAGSDITVFFLGAALVAATIAGAIVWVRTGGFGLFV